MRYLFISLCIILHISIFAQNQFEGRIFNKKDSTPIENAIVQIKEINTITKTDNKGYFKFNYFEQQIFKVKINHISFKDTVLKINKSEYKSFDIYLWEKTTQIDEITITASRMEKKLKDVASRIDIISSEEIENYPNTNFDNSLQSISNVYVNRSWGIFSKNSSVTMRGMDGTERVLVLLDGVPLNLSAGGGINWHMIESDQVERVEILKGPASALYGNNAMGGVINIITKKGTNSFFAEGSLFGGTYNTFGGKINICGNHIKNSKGFYYSANSFYRKGDGYIIIPEKERDSTDVKLGLKEYSFDFSAGYQVNTNQKIDISFKLYDDKRDEGIKIYEDNGSFLKYTTQHFQGSYTGRIGKAGILLKSFYQRQDYFQHSERLNETGDIYKLYDRNQVSKDFGVWLNMVNEFNSNYELSYGLDYKHGYMLADDIYYTSTDYFKRGGDIDYYAVFIQNEFRFFNNKFLLNVGLRADLAQFKNGFLYVENPTSITSFDKQLTESFQNTKWNNLSPKLAVQYKFSSKFRVYLSFSTGFMPPKLDDMVSSRKVNKGFKIANPYLKPETLTNYETGFDYTPSEKIKIEFSGYYAIGSDFQYFAHTGDTVDVDKPVLIRSNLGKATITGIETSFKWQIIKNLYLRANYTFNKSKITRFISQINYTNDDLTGKYLSETPIHQSYIGIEFINNLFNIGLVSNYVGSMWADEFNTEKLDAYTTFDIRISKKLKQFNLILDIQNIFDNQYIDKKNGLSPGRFIMIELGFRISK